ncbi:MAG: ABC transporter substrate-binding protein [Spirochaetales bacterium]|nr:ABC transporter substrate-binding protein [Leptospiraceae bacterium]MCP5482925.1 ABC transporter substrate-binding protein [Spirochaetales bacterium]MCP5484895.1 ABC transporter substrate-binding protein [Spirochaetales bacterium]
MYLRITATFLILTIVIACNGEAVTYEPVLDQEIPLQANGPVDPIAAASATRGGIYTAWGGPNPKSLNVWLDPWALSGQVMDLMFESLVTMHSTRNEPVGVLAESWTSSPDNMEFTFRLRPEARWSDGQPVTAEDIQFYYDTIMNEEHLTPVARATLSRFARPEVVDEHTVRIRSLETNWKAFWEAGGFVAFPKHIWEGQDFNRVNFEFPVVSGPYRLHDYRRNRFVVLQRRGDWWGRMLRYNLNKYNFDYLRFRFQEDRNAALETFKKGDYDVYSIYTASIWAQQTENIEAVERGWVVRQEIYNDEPRGFQGFAINLRRPKFQDVRVRQALAHLLNREQMLEQLMFNQYFLLNSYFPDLYPGNQNPAVPVVAYNPRRASDLLDQAGWEVGTDGIRRKDGQALHINFITYASDSRHMNIYVEDLRRAGLEVEVELLSKAEVTRRTDEFNFDLYWINTGAGRLRDPEPMFHSRYADEQASSNLAGVADARVDQLLEQLRRERNLSRRDVLLRQLDGRLMELSPYVLLWQSDRTRLLYWNRFGMPASVLDRFNREDVIPVYWFNDREKAERLAEAEQGGQELPKPPARIDFHGP